MMIALDIFTSKLTHLYIDILTGAARYPTVIGLFRSPENKSYGPRKLVTLFTVCSAKLLKLYVPGPNLDPYKIIKKSSYKHLETNNSILIPSFITNQSMRKTPVL